MNKLKQFRLMVGMTQAELAQSIGFTPAAISHYEKGRRGIDLSKCRILVTALNEKGAKVGIDDIFPPQ